MTVIIRVAVGMQPSLQPVSEEWPGEAQQMVDLMRGCWDQDPPKEAMLSRSSSSLPCPGPGGWVGTGEWTTGPQPIPESCADSLGTSA